MWNFLVAFKLYIYCSCFLFCFKSFYFVSCFSCLLSLVCFMFPSSTFQLCGGCWEATYSSWTLSALPDSSCLTPSLRRPYIHVHAIFFSTADRTACKHAFRFLRVLPEAVSTRHSWLWQKLDDVYTRRCFSESEWTRFGAPGQKALPSVNEFTLLWIFP